MFPKTGEKDAAGEDIRVSVPGYGKEFVYWHTNFPWGLKRTIQVKTAPLINILLNTWENENFFGDMIRNPNAPPTIQLMQQAEYLGEAMMPFAVQQFKRSIQQEDPLSRKVEAFAGITEVRREYRESQIVKDIYKAFEEQTGGTWRKTPEAQDFMGEKAQARKELKKGEFKTLYKLINAGKIKNVKQFVRDAYLSAPQRAFKHLASERRLALWQKMSKQEKEMYGFLMPRF